MGRPLYHSAETLHGFKYKQTLESNVSEYINYANSLAADGKRAQASQEKKQQREYLYGLRKLQKKYDFLLYLFHQEIEKSIEEGDYDSFFKLSSYELKGLFSKRQIRTKAFDFYKKKSTNRVCKILETEMQNELLLKESAEAFYEEIERATYNPALESKNFTKKVYIASKREFNSIDIFIHNENPYPITLSIEGSYINVKSTTAALNEIVLKAKSIYRYTRLELGADKSSYSYNYRWIAGGKDAKHDDSYLYRIPYKKGDSYIISQGYNGAYTHKGRSRYALDFAMPTGTGVYAAREGVVIKTKSASRVGGYDKKYASKGNYVTILHSDGTMAIYYHLKYRGTAVNVGDRVLRGQLIGYSGSTGYSSGPHLHFAVFQAISATQTDTIAVKFSTKKGAVETPTQGESYVAK